MSDVDNEDDVFKSKLYADLGAAWRDVKLASGAKDSTVETAKLTGKAAWNVAVFTAKFGVKFVKEAPRLMAEQASKNGRK